MLKIKKINNKTKLSIFIISLAFLMAGIYFYYLRYQASEVNKEYIENTASLEFNLEGKNYLIWSNPLFVEIPEQITVTPTNTPETTPSTISPTSTPQTQTSEPNEPESSISDDDTDYIPETTTVTDQDIIPETTTNNYSPSQPTLTPNLKSSPFAFNSAEPSSQISPATLFSPSIIQSPTSEKQKNNLTKWFLGICIPIILIIAGWIFWQRYKEYQRKK